MCEDNALKLISNTCSLLLKIAWFLFISLGRKKKWCHWYVVDQKGFHTQERLGNHVSSSFKRNSVLSICLNMFSLALLNHGRINVLVDKIPFYSLLIPYKWWFWVISIVCVFCILKTMLKVVMLSFWRELGLHTRATVTICSCSKHSLKIAVQVTES